MYGMLFDLSQYITNAECHIYDYVHFDNRNGRRDFIVGSWELTHFLLFSTTAHGRLRTLSKII